MTLSTRAIVKRDPLSPRRPDLNGRAGRRARAHTDAFGQAMAGALTVTRIPASGPLPVPTAPAQTDGWRPMAAIPVQQLESLPAGEQPETGGRLLCRLCGRWYRSLGHHLVGPRHRMTPDDYRARYELPATRALMAADLRQAQAARASERLANSPELQAAFELDVEDSPRRARWAVQARARKAETEPRAGVQRSKQMMGEILAQSSRRRSEQLRREFDELARRRGYRDGEHLIHATVGLSHPQLGDLLGMAAHNARSWRRRYDLGSGYSRNPEQLRSAAAAGRRARSAAVRAGYDEAARRAGYDDIVALLQARGNAQAARLLGVHRDQPQRLRRRYLPEPLTLTR